MNLRCPFCEEELEVAERVTGRDAVLRCGCARYPVVDGVPILKQASWGASFDPALALERLHAHDARGALAAVLPAAGGSRVMGALLRRASRAAGLVWGGVPRRRLDRTLDDPHATFAGVVHALSGSGFANYLEQRYANPSFLSALALTPVLARHFAGAPARILDLGCGAGHLAHAMTRALPAARITAVDLDYRNLHLARRFIAPTAEYVCLDAEFPLPFPSGSFDAVVCLDTFHYLRPKAALVRELTRVASADALWLFAHLHNALQENPSAGIPLSPDGYRRCFAPASPRLFTEAGLLRDFAGADAVDLRSEPDAGALAASPALCMVGSRDPATWQRYERASAVLCGGGGAPVVNPIYRVEDAGPQLRLQMQWPAEEMRRECRLVEELMPRETTLSRDALARDPAPAELVRRFVLVHAPGAASASRER